MPSSRFPTYLAKVGLSLAGIDACKAEFSVSFEAAAHRAMDLTSESACLFIAAMSRTMQQERLGTGEPVLRVVRWRPSPHWPHRDGYKNKPVAPGSLIGQAFTYQDERHARTRLGLPFASDTYELEARGYGYSRSGNASYRQAVSLARALVGGAAV